MEKQLKHIPFEEFADNLESILEKVIHDHKPVYVKSQSGELIEVRSVGTTSPRRGEFTAEEDEAFLSAAGSWNDVDIDEFLQDIYESRNSSRPPVDL